MNEETSGRHLFVGNQPSLDFINTEIMENDRRVDRLETPADLLAWLSEAGMLDANGMEQAAREWGDPAVGAKLLEQGRALRTVLREMAESLIEGRGAPVGALTAINSLLRMRQGYEEVVAEEGRFYKQFHFRSTQPEHLLIPIAEEASDLLCNADLSLVKRCENPACILYFYDTTKNHARRWCSMSACGNRHKQAAHYRRVRVAK